MIGLVRRFFAESLFKNSAFLLVNLGIGALSGFGGLALLTHAFSVTDIGLSATAVSAAALIETITLLGVTFSVPRYLPTAKNRTAMINTLLTAVISLTLLASGIFLALPYSRQFFALGGWLFPLVFAVAMCIQVGTTLLYSVLIADRAADTAVTLNMIPAFIRVIAPPALSFLGGLGSFVARVVPDSFSFFLYGTVLVRRGHRFRPTLDIGVARELGRFSIGMYVSNIVGGLPAMLLPLIALARIGASETAYWTTAMSISATLYSLPSMVTSALLPEVSLRPAERSHLLRRSSLLIVAVVTPALVVAFFAAPIVLPLFGPKYASGSLPVLRWLIVAGFVAMLNAVTGAILFVAKKSTQLTIVNAVDAVIVIGLVALWATNATDIAIAWDIGEIVNTVLFAAFAFLAVREVGGRLDKLGGDQVSDISVVPEKLSAGSQQSALDLLVALAQQQHAVGMYNMYKPYSPGVTSPRGIYSIAALQAAEQRRLARTARPRGGEASDGAVDTHQALDLLFTMADQQRAAGITEPEEQYPPGDVAQPPSYGPPSGGYPVDPQSGGYPYGPPPGGHPYGG